jgi:hypothetical protein
MVWRQPDELKTDASRQACALAIGISGRGALHSLRALSLSRSRGRPVLGFQRGRALQIIAIGDPHSTAIFGQHNRHLSVGALTTADFALAHDPGN